MWHRHKNNIFGCYYFPLPIIIHYSVSRQWCHHNSVNCHISLLLYFLFFILGSYLSSRWHCNLGCMVHRFLCKNVKIYVFVHILERKKVAIYQPYHNNITPNNKFFSFQRHPLYSGTNINSKHTVSVPPNSTTNLLTPSWRYWLRYLFLHFIPLPIYWRYLFKSETLVVGTKVICFVIKYWTTYVDGY